MSSKDWKYERQSAPIWSTSTLWTLSTGNGGRGLLQLGQGGAVGRGQLLGQGRLEHRQGLAELHRAALEVAQDAEDLLGGALLQLGVDHASALRPPMRLPRPDGGPCRRRRAGGWRSWPYGKTVRRGMSVTPPSCRAIGFAPRLPAFGALHPAASSEQGQSG